MCDIIQQYLKSVWQATQLVVLSGYTVRAILTHITQQVVIVDFDVKSSLRHSVRIRLYNSSTNCMQSKWLLLSSSHDVDILP